ncbi:MAG: Ldh family oxidoreductase [Clostridia bacterium]|nr:Ldh family oxidoreductase [Clostridia bacterium]
MAEKFCFTETKNRITDKLTFCGVPQNQAEIFADCLATADLYGVSSHGSRILSAHIEKIKRGDYNMSPSFTILRETAAFAVIDGDNSIGAVSADYCMNYAVEKCEKSGMFTVFSNNNNTFGPAFYYPMKAAQKGYIALIASNSPAQMAPVGGKEKLLGTNPFAAVIPVPNGQPIILDMATSVVAKSKFKEYKESGKQLPDGWALDVNGNPTNDPDEGIKGLVLPMAGFKGYGIAMLIDILSGVLSGAAYLNNVGRFYSPDGDCMNVGYYITVIDPVQVLGENYGEIISDFVNTLRHSPTAEGQTIALPGDDRLKAKEANADTDEINPT